MCAICESCDCVLNFMLGQPGGIRNGPSKVVTFHHHGWELDGDPEGKGEQADAHLDSQHDVHTYL